MTSYYRNTYSLTQRYTNLPNSDPYTYYTNVLRAINHPKVKSSFTLNNRKWTNPEPGVIELHLYSSRLFSLDINPTPPICTNYPDVYDSALTYRVLSEVLPNYYYESNMYKDQAGLGNRHHKVKVDKRAPWQFTMDPTGTVIPIHHEPWVNKTINLKYVNAWIKDNLPEYAPTIKNMKALQIPNLDTIFFGVPSVLISDYLTSRNESTLLTILRKLNRTHFAEYIGEPAYVTKYYDNHADIKAKNPSRTEYHTYTKSKP
jgi:hypothetical protein